MVWSTLFPKTSQNFFGFSHVFSKPHRPMPLWGSQCKKPIEGRLTRMDCGLACGACADEIEQEIQERPSGGALGEKKATAKEMFFGYFLVGLMFFYGFIGFFNGFSKGLQNATRVFDLQESKDANLQKSNDPSLCRMLVTCLDVLWNLFLLADSEELRSLLANGDETGAALLIAALKDRQKILRGGRGYLSLERGNMGWPWRTIKIHETNQDQSRERNN